MEIDGQGMTVLDRSACTDLLANTRLGRIGLTHQALPMILPVAFGLLDNDLVFDVGPGVIRRAAEDRQVVCFQADWADERFIEAWSVWAIGTLSLMSDPERTQRARDLDLAVWAGQGRTFVSLAPELVSGRRRSVRQ